MVDLLLGGPGYLACLCVQFALDLNFFYHSLYTIRSPMGRV